MAPSTYIRNAIRYCRDQHGMSVEWIAQRFNKSVTEINAVLDTAPVEAAVEPAAVPAEPEPPAPAPAPTDAHAEAVARYRQRYVEALAAARARFGPAWQPRTPGVLGIGEPPQPPGSRQPPEGALPPGRHCIDGRVVIVANPAAGLRLR
jgi:hypothetical protein